MKKKLLCAAMIMIMVLGTLVMASVCGGSSDKRRLTRIRW